MMYHNPVLLEESVDGLNIKEDGIYVDVTFGGGGHSREILNHLGEKGRLFGFDQDKDAIENKIDDERFTLIQENFRYVKRFLRFYGIKKVDGILGDFGVSSYQFNEAERGFSTRFEAKLDMRMDQDSALSAYQVINEYGEAKLKDIFYRYADLKNAPKLARIIVEERQGSPIEDSKRLNDLLSPHLFKGKENKILAQIYQAIRIEVNQELEVLKEFLSQTEDLVVKGGRLSLISYHSLEDRLVKRYIRSGLFEGEPEKDFFGNISVPFKKVGKLITPTKEEVSENNRARSAKLRIAKKL